MSSWLIPMYFLMVCCVTGITLSSRRVSGSRIERASSLPMSASPSNPLNERKVNIPSTPQTADYKHYIALGMVPVFWGTYPPLVKHLFETSTVPVPPILFNLLSYAVSFGVFSIATMQTKQELLQPIDENRDLLWRGGIELGIWLFLGSLLLVSGIEVTSATRAAILVQLTTIIVPVLDTLLSRQTPNPTVIASCLFAAVGVLLVTIDTTFGNLWQMFASSTTTFSATAASAAAASSASSILNFNTGDFMVILAACFYSLHVVRLGAISNRIKSAASLARIKSLTQMVTAIVLASFLALTNSTEATHFLDYAKSVFAPLLHSSSTVVASEMVWKDGIVLFTSVLWNGALCTGFTMWAQTFAQRVIPATQANIVYTCQPVWAALFSYIFVGESLSNTALLGGAIIAAAVILAVQSKPQK